MYKRFLRQLPLGMNPDPQTLIFLSGIGGILLGSLDARAFPTQELRLALDALFASPTGVVNQILCALVPLLAAALLFSVGAPGLGLCVAPALATAAFSFPMGAMFSAFGTAGAVPGAILMAGRAGSLLFLVWFLLNADASRRLLRPLTIAACGTAASVLLTCFLTEPFLRELYQTVFISL